jgi:hypothetical protein
MKKITFLLLALTGGFASAQSYETGVVTLGPGVSAKVVTTATTVTLTMNGPSDRWFGVGFGNNSMNSGDILVVNSATTISDRNFVGIGVVPPTDTQDWTITSNTTSGVTRTVVATRSLTTTDTSTDFQFTNSTASFQMCSVRGGSANNYTLGSHGGLSNAGNALTGARTLPNDTFALAGFKMYPNPADEIFAIELPQNVDAVTVKMFDILGKLVLTKEITALQNKLDITTLKAGNYIVKVIGNEQEYSTNLIIE